VTTEALNRQRLSRTRCAQTPSADAVFVSQSGAVNHIVASTYQCAKIGWRSEAARR